MKKVNLLILCGILMMSIWSCQNEKEQVTSATISGEITNPKGELVTFSIGEETITDTLDGENKFVTSITLNRPSDIVFGHGGEITWIYLRPGDDLFLSLDTDEFDESLVYSGTGAEINNFKAAYLLWNDTVFNYRELMALDESAFITKMDSIEAAAANLMVGYKIADEEFETRFVTTLKFNHAMHKYNYPRNHKHYAELDSFQVSNGYYAFAEEIDLDDSSQLNYPEFKYYVNTVVSNKTSERYAALENQNIDSYYSLYMEVLLETVNNKTVQGEMLFDQIYDGFTYLPDSLRDGMITLWKEELSPKADQIAMLNEKAGKWAKLTKGNPAPDFRYASIEGDTLSMGNFLGKLVYIDVWATWCGPCIGEHPSMEKLQERFKDSDVVFLAVSIDSTPDPWRKMIAEKNLGGVHVYAPGAWGSTIIEDYMISGIPRFILVDRQGKILDSNAARPSGDIGDRIEDLLREQV